MIVTLLAIYMISSWWGKAWPETPKFAVYPTS
jgi:hypothetical protein